MNKAIEKQKNKENEQAKYTNRRRKHRSGGRTGRRTKEMIAIAKNRINILMQLAETESIVKNNQSRACRYVKMARNLGMRYNVRLDKEYNNVICRGCNTYLGSSSNSSIRFRGGKKVITCKNCGRTKRLRYR
jgi:RNase P subunit RPR2